MTAELEAISALSRTFGTESYVLGGGGNTSVKSGDTLWVKPSGCTLAEMTPDRFLALDRTAIDQLFDAEIPAESSAREALVKSRMADAVKAGSHGRPSVEAPLHHLLPARFVVHTHPTLMNGLTCSRQGQAECAKRFPEALWVEYTDPGFVLCRDVRQALSAYCTRHGRGPTWLVLQNHGVFVSGDTVEEVREAYATLFARLEPVYAAAGCSQALVVGPTPTEADQQKMISALRSTLPTGMADAVAVSGAFRLFGGPLTPDHVVCAGAFACRGIRREDLEAHHDRHGRHPRVVGSPNAVCGLGRTQAAAELALALARDAVRVEQLAMAFGGPRYLDDRSRLFIENWEVEAYRQQVMSGGTLKT